MRQVFKVVLPAVIAAVLILLPGAAYAQTGAISGVARDASGGALPGVLVEVTSPALIEKVRSTQTDGNGRYQITALPVGVYKVTFTLQGFNVTSRENVQLTSDFTATVNGEMKVGDIKEVLEVTANTPLVDIQNARQQTVITGEELRELPTERNLPALLNLVPGITTTRGICSGGVGVFCSPNISSFNAHASGLDSIGQGSGLNQGRIMIDGMVINSANPGITGITSGYQADVANAQEISFNLSGSLGESETGGASLNIVPRTGGNRYSGNFFTSYTQMRWFDKNNETRDSVTVLNQEFYDYDVTGSYGGPIIKDRLWFFSTARTQGKEAYPFGGLFYPNRNFDPENPTAKPGINYQPDRTQESVRYTNEYKNINLRLTVQATQKNKFNVFWDEQDSCQDPCTGVVATYTSPESWWSVAVKPNHLGQLSWTNPLTNRLLLEAGITAVMQHYDLTKSREFFTPKTIPRIVEFGATASKDEVADSVNGFATIFGLTSGSLNDGIGAGGSELRNSDNYRSRASASYITGSHNAKIGYEGAYYTEKATNNANDLRLTYRYDTPSGTCYNATTPSLSTCGNTSLYWPDDPYNQARRTVPTRFTINTGIGTIEDRVWYGAFYLQDQWTLNRVTLSGALRYDHAASSYGETCVGPDIYVPVQIGGAYDGQNRYCTEPSDGVSYDDITPRFGMAWDVFGTGKTSVKVNVGKYLAGASLGGLYSNVNPARRTANTLERGWADNNGNRIPDCDMFNFAAQNNAATGGDTCNAVTANSANRYGRDPLALDAEGRNPITTTNCGQSLDRSTDLARAYCEASGDNLVNGWGARRYEWQYGVGVQHELLPRLSAEVTYNRRQYGNQTISDVMGLGCDKFNSTDVTECQQSYLNYANPNFDFYTLQAPPDPRLPGGGAYVIKGLFDEATLGAQPNNGTAVTFAPELSYGWHGVDTNFSLRGRGGFRISGGTSTGRGVRDTCFATLDAPDVKGREGNEYHGGCIPDAKWTTNARANMSYTIPYIDVLASAVFQYRPGPARSANLTYNRADVVWDAEAAERANADCILQGQPAKGCFYNGATTQGTATTNLLDFGDMYGESIRLWDLKFAKNIRFGNKRINLGVDVYNLFNSDAIVDYENTYTATRLADGTWVADNPATPTIEVNNWGRAVTLTSPRFARFQVQFDF